MKVIFSKYAKMELDDAVCFYELRYTGFRAEIQKRSPGCGS